MRARSRPCGSAPSSSTRAPRPGCAGCAGDAVEHGDRHEEGAPEGPDLVLHVALLVAGVGVAEAVVEAVVGCEGREQLGRPYLAVYLAADTGGVVEHEPGRHAADVLEYRDEPAADALGVLAGEYLWEPDVGEREAPHQVVHPPSHAHDPEVCLAEVDLHLPGQPVEVEVLVARRAVIVPPALDVPVHRVVRALVALLVAQALEHALRRVALLVPVRAVPRQPLVDLGLVRVQYRWELPPHRHPGAEVLLPEVLAHGGLRDAHAPGDLGNGVATPPHLSYILDLGHADHFLSDPP